MHIVAVTRWGAPLDKEIAPLAARLGMVAYDLRLRLTRGLPAVFARVEDPMEAAAHTEFLRGRGHGAVTCEVDAVPGPDEQLVPVTFELTATALRGTSTDGGGFELPLTDIVAMVHVACVTSVEDTVTRREKKFAPGRALLSGGMVLRKTVNRVDKTVNQDQERMIYVFCRSRPGFCVWKELTLSYDGLGDERQLTTAQNFALLSEKLHQLAPDAFHDERLLTHKRRADISAFSVGARRQRVETSNASENDLAAYLLVRGYLEGQL